MRGIRPTSRGSCSTHGAHSSLSVRRNVAIVLVLFQESQVLGARSLTYVFVSGTGSDSASGGDAGSVAAVLRGFTPRVWEIYVTRRVNLRNVDDFAAVRGGRSLTFDEWAEGLTIGQVDEESYEEEEDEAQLAATLARFEPAHALGLLTAKLGEVTAGLAQGEAGADVAAAALLELSMLTLSDSAGAEVTSGGGGGWGRLRACSSKPLPGRATRTLTGRGWRPKFGATFSYA